MGPRRRPAGGCSRRQLLGGILATAATAGLAGCAEATSYEFRATPVVLGSDARAALDYATLDRERVVTERSREVGGVDLTVTVENHTAVYGASGEPGGSAEAPTVGAVSTPRATVMGRSFNPLARLSLANLLTSDAGTRFLVRTGLDDVGSGSKTVRWVRGPTRIAEQDGRCLGTETTLESYAGVLGGDPPSVVFVHLTRVDADDVVLAAAVHGHDVTEPDRTFVGPDTGYLSPDDFAAAVGTYATATAGLTYPE